MSPVHTTKSISSAHSFFSQSNTRSTRSIDASQSLYVSPGLPASDFLKEWEASARSHEVRSTPCEAAEGGKIRFLLHGAPSEGYRVASQRPSQPTTKHLPYRIAPPSRTGLGRLNIIVATTTIGVIQSPLMLTARLFLAFAAVARGIEAPTRHIMRVGVNVRNVKKTAFEFCVSGRNQTEGGTMSAQVCAVRLSQPDVRPVSCVASATHKHTAHGMRYVVWTADLDRRDVAGVSLTFAFRLERHLLVCGDSEREHASGGEGGAHTVSCSMCAAGEIDEFCR